MAVPKRKTTPRRRNLRRTHQGLAVPGLSVDKQSGGVHRSHHVDLTTGLYRGRQVLFPEANETDADNNEA